MKKIIVSLFLIILAGIAGFAVYYGVNYRAVNFTLKDGSYSLTIENSDKKLVSTVKSTGKISLPRGNYTYHVNGTNLDDSGHEFTVGDKDSNITVSPVYSKDYLQTLALKEQDTIWNLLTNKYPDLAPLMSLTALQLYDKGEWAAGTLNYTVDPRVLPDIYRFVLKKSGDTWQLVVSPRIAINKNDFKDIPESILDSLYTSSS